MKTFMTIIAGWLVLSAHLQAAPLAAGEWFIDTDPGEGSGTAITGVSGDSLSQDITIAPAIIEALSSGPHLLGVRFQDNTGAWGQVQWRLFLVTHPGNDLVAGEYFFNTDPGEGAGLPLSDISGESVTITPAPSLDGLPYGANLIGIRFQNSAGDWSQSAFRVFLNPEPAAQALNSIEYTLLKDDLELASGAFLGDGSLVIDIAQENVDATLTESDTLVLQLQAADDRGKTGHKLFREITVKDFTQDFLDLFFSPAEQSNPSISGPLADADLDGLTNLIEQAAGLHPRIANKSDEAVKLDAVGDNPKTFRFRAAAESTFDPASSTFSLGSLRLEVEVSDNAEIWNKATSPADFTISAESEANDDGSFSHILTLTENGQTKRFHRLRVIQE